MIYLKTYPRSPCFLSTREKTNPKWKLGRNKIRRFYSKLNLDGFNKSEKILKRYVESMKDFKLSSYKMDDDVKEKTYKKLKFTLEEFGYDK